MVLGLERRKRSNGIAGKVRRGPQMGHETFGY